MQQLILTLQEFPNQKVYGILAEHPFVNFTTPKLVSFSHDPLFVFETESTSSQKMIWEALKDFHHEKMTGIFQRIYFTKNGLYLVKSESLSSVSWDVLIPGVQGLLTQVLLEYQPIFQKSEKKEGFFKKIF